MNFHPQEASQSRTQGSGAAVVLQIDDLNNLIDSLKRREENIIQLLDYNLKFRGSSNHMDVIHLRGLYNQLEEKEKKRIEQEDLVIQKYIDLYISDEYQRKLIFKMKNKIIQLNSSARDKLIQLGIYKQARQAYIGLSTFEETLGQIVNKTPLDSHLFLNRIVENSRKRFYDEIEQDPAPVTEFIKQKSLDATQTPSKSLALPKPAMAKSVTPSILTKEEKRHYEADDHVNSPIDNVDPPEVVKVERTSFIVKSIEQRPNFDIREDLKASFDMLGIQKPSYARYSSETTRYQESNSRNETIIDQTSPNKPLPSYRESNNAKTDVMGLNLNFNGSNMGGERSQAVGSNISSRTPYVKKVKITSNKRSVCLEETNLNQQQQDQKEAEKKELKPNKEAWLKNYDILKIEYTPLPTATKKETKKLLMEKVYKELLATNTEIKKTIKRYSSTCASIISREHDKEELSKKRPENIDCESNRNIIYTPKAYSSVAPLKTKAQTLNPSQRNIFFADSTREAEQTEIGCDNFLNAMNPFYPNSTSNKQNKDILAKKSGSTKFLVLPKLNLFPENQTQNPFPQVWPVSSQGSKPIKSNLIVEIGNRVRFEKSQKVGDRPMNHLLADTKQTIMEQEKTGIYIVNQHIAGSRVFPNSSNKSYPLTLFPFDAGLNMNKQIPL